MRKGIVFLFGFLLVPSSPSHAGTYWGGEIPDIRHTEVRAEVTLSEGIYTYTYTITTSTANTGYIWVFEVDVRYPYGSAEVSSEGLVVHPSYYEVLEFPRTPRMIPGELNDPEPWSGDFSVGGEAIWGGPLIPPGAGISGMTIRTRGLPGLRDFRVLPELVPPEEGSDADIDAVEDQSAYKGKTIGPTAPPLFLDYGEFTSTLEQYLNESLALGWLRDPALATTLRNELVAARTAIQGNDPTAAKEALERFKNALNAASLSQRTSEAYGLLFYNAQFLQSKLPDTYVPPVYKLELTPQQAHLAIGVPHTLTVTYTVDRVPTELPGVCAVILRVLEGPNAGLSLEGVPQGPGVFTYSYTSTGTGTDRIVADLPEVPDGCSALTSAPVEVVWEGGPDLMIPFFLPPLIEGEGGEAVTIIEITRNHGNARATTSITRYFLSRDREINPAQDLPLGERAVPSLEPGEESRQRQVLSLPRDLTPGMYYLGACADAEGTVVELNEGNNCENNRLSFVLPLKRPLNHPPSCTQASPSRGILWPPNHRLATIAIQGVTDPDGDPVRITIRSITQDEPTNGLGDGDTSPDGFGIGTTTAEIRAERSGKGNGRVYAISFQAEDGKGGACRGEIRVGVPHDMGRGRNPLDDGQRYDSTRP